MKKLFLGLAVAVIAIGLGLGFSAQAAEPTSLEAYTFSPLTEQATFNPYGESYDKGVAAAIGDVTGDSRPEFVTISGQGTRTFVRVFDEFGNPLAWSVQPFHEAYQDGGSVAVGDVDGDGVNEIVATPSGEGGPIVRVFEYGNDKPEQSFFVFVEQFRGGVNVACGDTNNNGQDEIIVATASDRGQVAIYTGEGAFTGLAYFPFGPTFRDGLSVAAGDVTGNGKTDIVTGSQGATTSRVKVYKADASKKILGDFLAFGESFQGGVNVATADTNADSIDEIITSVASSGAPHVVDYSVAGTKIGQVNFFPFDESATTGVDIAAGSGWLLTSLATREMDTDFCKDHKCVALTFDDGGSANGSFDRILNTLGEHDVKGTFFLIGRWMNGNRGWVRRVYDEGHRLGNHTWNHSICTKIPNGQITSELQQSDDLVKMITGEPTKPHFRYPGGGHDGRTDAVVQDAGYYYWQWTSDPRDAMGNNDPGSIKNIALSGLHDGSVILFHTGSYASSVALDGIITEIKRQGYEIVTLDYIDWQAGNQW